MLCHTTFPIPQAQAIISNRNVSAPDDQSNNDGIFSLINCEFI